MQAFNKSQLSSRAFSEATSKCTSKLQRYIRLVLEKMRGHQLKAAEILGIDPKTIYRTLKGKID